MKTLMLAGAMAGAMACFASDDVHSYSIPKDHPPIAPAAAQSAPGGDLEINSAPIQWTTPAGWRELAPTAIRIGNFLVPGPNGRNAEVAVTSFPGAVGSEIDNVNRWRREIGLTGVGPNEFSFETVTIGSDTGKRYDFTGKVESTVVVSLPREGAMWFFKLRGDSETVANAKPAFSKFLKSIQFGKGAPVAAAPAADPHAGLAPEALSAPSANEPKWKVPSNWTAGAPRPMVVKVFNVEDGQASVAISTFPGDVGGAFANVNRWRGQLGLPPVAQDELPSVTKSIDAGSAQAILVDFKGTDPATSKPTRLVAAIVRHGDGTWFYKMIGSDAVVDREKSAFVQFVQTVQYP